MNADRSKEEVFDDIEKIMDYDDVILGGDLNWENRRNSGFDYFQSGRNTLLILHTFILTLNLPQYWTTS